MSVRSDKEYQAKWDAETLAQAGLIQSDPTRLAQAKAMAKIIAKEQEDSFKAMRKVAGNALSSPVRKNNSRNYNGMVEPPVPIGGSFNVFKKI